MIVDVWLLPLTVSTCALPMQHSNNLIFSSHDCSFCLIFNISLLPMGPAGGSCVQPSSGWAPPFWHLCSPIWAELFHLVPHLAQPKPPHGQGVKSGTAQNSFWWWKLNVQHKNHKEKAKKEKPALPKCGHLSLEWRFRALVPNLAWGGRTAQV